jgi:DNA modification methylase
MNVAKLRNAALDLSNIDGLTHQFYRYPARFSPAFAAAAIRCFSKRGQLVLDPYMGGGTTVVEAVAAGRRAVGSDINSLAVFITRVKTTPLSRKDSVAVRAWADAAVNQISYRYTRSAIADILDDTRTGNLSLPRARAIKKAVAIALSSIIGLPTPRSQDFARCAILKTAQWALDNRNRPTELAEFRDRLEANVGEMLNAIEAFADVLRQHGRVSRGPVLMEYDAARIDSAPIFRRGGRKVDLVIASPPYPGVHVLYHRWQVDGRRESAAPFWIADCQDGHGSAYYTFGDRRREDCDFYFDSLFATLKSIRKTMKKGARMVQMVAFSEPKKQLDRYLNNMTTAGFEETIDGARRIWRSVPNRKWHATFKGDTPSSREVVLIHRAV